METYAEQAAALYRQAAETAGGDYGNAIADRLLKAADGLTRLAAIEKGLPADWQGTEGEDRQPAPARDGSSRPGRRDLPRVAVLRPRGPARCGRHR